MRSSRILMMLMAGLAIWAIVLGPGLCVGGALHHLCFGCESGGDVGGPSAQPYDHGTDPCAHEENCSTDPCVEPLSRPASIATFGFLAPVVVLVACFSAPEFDVAESPFVPRELLLPPGKNLPVPESDLPLLI